MVRHPQFASGMYLARVVQRRIICRAHFELTLAMPSFPDAVPGQFVQVLCNPPAARREVGEAKSPRLSTEQIKRPSADGASESTAVDAATGALVPPWMLAGAVGSPLLRRPFSIGGLRRQSDYCEIRLLGRVVGSGSKWLATLSQGDHVDLIGPLGRGFALPARGSRAVLVAGGTGLPPIRWLGEILAQQGCAGEALYGAQTRDLVPLSLLEEPRADGTPTLCAAEFAESGVPVAISTDDGSCGMHGRVTDLLVRYLGGSVNPAGLQVYACGPEPMLRTVTRLCAACGSPCQVALERRMGCGMGTCQSCVVRVRDGVAEPGWRYAMCCLEGPIFDAASVLWE